MDLVRKISLCAVSTIMILYSASCERHAGVRPEMYYRIVRFSQREYKDYVLAERDANVIMVKGYSMGPWHSDSTARGGHYIALEKNCYIAEYFYFWTDDVIINKSWSDWTHDEIYFSSEDILTEHPYSDYYQISETVFNAEIFFPISDEIISRINAMIDDGSIKQYRVDLGY